MMDFSTLRYVALTLIAMLYAGVTTAGAARAEAAPPIVDVAWLAPRVCSADLVVLDLRRSVRNFEAEHLPCAVHSDYYNGGWRMTRAGVENMVPAIDRLEKLIGSLGIGNTTHVVLVTAALDMFSPAELARVYFIFRALGHDAVSILDGGIAAWTADWDNDIEVGPATVRPTSFTAHPRAAMIAGRGDAVAALDSGLTLVDMRANDHYLGINSSPVVVRPGTIPGAINLPMMWLVVDGKLRFRTRAQIRRLWRAAGLDADGAQILFCNSGLESAIGWLSLGGILGNENVRLYDGSLAEWSADPALPMELKVPLE